MLCDELKRFDIVGKYSDEDTMYEFKPDGECYDADEVDEAIEELKAENRRLKRALWIAHEYKAKFKRWWLHLALDYESSMIRPNAKTINRIRGKIENCVKSERKCRAKAEERK